MNVNRSIAASLRKVLSMYPIAALTGPRQSGKTTLLRSEFPEYTYVNLENLDNRSFAEEDPNGFLAVYSSKVIFDEVQRVPSLFSYIQTLVDDKQQTGQFILSGSQNFHLMEKITQSLAGRVAILKLFPFDHKELASAQLESDNYLDCILKGYYPAIYDRNIPSKTFYANYIETYIQRDVSELVSIRDLRAFKRFFALCATRAGQLVNFNSLANECDISQPTAKSWFSALENSYILFTLQPYYKNYSKRIVKTPKLYFYDTGLLCHLLKINSVEKINTHPFKGALFENMMIAEYVKRMYHIDSRDDIWFWRDSAGHEVDFIIESSEGLELVEFKSTKTIMPEMFKSIRYFDDLSHGDVSATKLVYGGEQGHKRSAGQIVSWRDFGKTI